MTGPRSSYTCISTVHRLLIDHFHWKKADFLACNLQAVDHAFASSAVKTELRARLEAGYRP